MKAAQLPQPLLQGSFSPFPPLGFGCRPGFWPGRSGSSRRARGSPGRARPSRTRSRPDQTARRYVRAMNSFGRVVASEAELREVIPASARRVAASPEGDRPPRSALPRLHRPLAAAHARHGRCGGGCDVSPRGGPPGFATLDHRRLLVPDFPGNRRLDSQRNLLDNPRASLLFLIPGLARRCGSRVAPASPGTRPCWPGWPCTAACPSGPRRRGGRRLHPLRQGLDPIGRVAARHVVRRAASASKILRDHMASPRSPRRTSRSGSATLREEAVLIQPRTAPLRSSQARELLSRSAPAVADAAGPFYLGREGDGEAGATGGPSSGTGGGSGRGGGRFRGIAGGGGGATQ